MKELILNVLAIIGGISIIGISIIFFFARKIEEEDIVTYDDNKNRKQKKD